MLKARFLTPSGGGRGGEGDAKALADDVVDPLGIREKTPRPLEEGETAPYWRVSPSDPFPCPLSSLDRDLLRFWP